MFKLYEVARINVGKNADKKLVALVASVAGKYSR